MSGSVKRRRAQKTTALVDPVITKAYRTLDASLKIIDALAPLPQAKRFRVLAAVAILHGLDEVGSEAIALAEAEEKRS